jgi:hypothetical protein
VGVGGDVSGHVVVVPWFGRALDTFERRKRWCWIIDDATGSTEATMALCYHVFNTTACATGSRLPLQSRGVPCAVLMSRAPVVTEKRHS